MNKINFFVNYSDRFPNRIISEMYADSASVDVYIKPDEVFDCLEDLLADWDCLNRTQKQTLNEIADRIMKLMEDEDV